jgi:hypothetical protein
VYLDEETINFNPSGFGFDYSIKIFAKNGFFEAGGFEAVSISR